MRHRDRGCSTDPLTAKTGYRITWFGPDRPVGGTVAVRAAAEAADVDAIEADADGVSSEAS